MRASFQCVRVFYCLQAASSVLTAVPLSVAHLLLILTYALPLQVHSEGSLVQLATPDFSMPYNVICLSSTVMGVFVGSTLNTLLYRPGPRSLSVLDLSVLDHRNLFRTCSALPTLTSSY